MAKFLRCVSLAFLGIMTACGGGVSNTTSGNSHSTAVLQSIQVQAASQSFAAGAAEQFTATGTYSDGTTKDLSHSASWTTSDSTIATINGSGTAKGMAPGSVTVVATQTAISGSLSATVSAAPLKSISVSLASSSVAVGATEQITATGHYTDGSTQNVSTSVAWTVSNMAVASISGSGLVTATSTGSTTITATLGSISSSANLNVSNAALVSIAVTSANGSAVAGASDQFSATGTYSDGSSHALTTVKWTIFSSTAATISNTGLVSTKIPGTAVVTATQGSISGTANLTISAAALTSIAVNAASSSVAVGSTDQITAVGTYSDGTTQNLTNSVTWTLSNTGLASISSAGLVTASSNGTETVTAASGSISGSASVTINASLSSIAVTPAAQTIALATTQQFHALGTYTDGSTQDLTATANWTSSQPPTASVDANGPTAGLAHGVKAGVSTITASVGTVSGSATLTVSAATLASIALTPLNSKLPLGVAEQFNAQGTFSDGTTQDVTSSVTWSTSSSSIASMTVNGLATAHNLGTATITATSTGGITANTPVTVNAANLVSMTIQGNFTLAHGTSTKLSAIGLFNDGGTRDISTQATWSSSNPVIAAAQYAGKIQSITPGSAVITATLGSQTASATEAVTNATIVSISVTPAVSSTAIGTQKSFTATGSFFDSTTQLSSTQVISSDVAWSSSDPTIATLGSSATVSGVGSGTATISATFNSISGSAQLTVNSVNVTAVAINPTSAILAPGTTQQFSAVATFSDNTTQSASTLVTWSTSDASIASINATGLVTGQSSGTATITASYGIYTATSTVLVEASGALTSVTVSPAASTVPKQIMTGFTATGHFSDGSTQDLTTLVTWTSSKASVATISNGSSLRGFATGIAPGTSTISAWFNGGQVATSTLTVTNATLVSLQVTPSAPVVSVGKTQGFVATATFSDASTANVSNQAVWTSSDISAAVVSSTGAVSGVSAGSAVIDATLNGVSDATTVTVQ